MYLLILFVLMEIFLIKLPHFRHYLTIITFDSTKNFAHKNKKNIRKYNFFIDNNDKRTRFFQKRKNS